MASDPPLYRKAAKRRNPPLVYMRRPGALCFRGKMESCGARLGGKPGGLPLLLENVKEDDSAAPPPETPTETMEFLARSWSLSATELSKALGDALPPTSSRDVDDFKFLRGPPRAKTMAGWLKDHKERRRSEARTRAAQIYAAISVAGVAAVVAATAAGSVFSPDSVSSKCGGSSKAGAAISSAAALVASHCVESARAIGASRQQILAVIHSAVNARTTGDVMALTAGAATALRAAAILGARMKKETNGGVLMGDDKEADGCSSALTFVYRGGDLLKRTRKALRATTILGAMMKKATNGGVLMGDDKEADGCSSALTSVYSGGELLKRTRKALRATTILGAMMKKATNGGVLMGDDKEADGCSSALTSVYSGGELLKRTRKCDLHWKQVSVCINSHWQVVVKMKSKCIAGTFVKKKKGAVVEVCSDVPAWPGRGEDGSSSKAYFGIRTLERLIEFECRSKCEKEMWVDGVMQTMKLRANMSSAMSV